jgi:hypothetical protein
MHAARLTAVAMFSSTDEISSLMIFTGQPILRPNRFLSNDSPFGRRREWPEAFFRSAQVGDRCAVSR